MKEYFRFESSIQDGKDAAYPCQGKFFYVYGGSCPFNAAFSFIKDKRVYVILNVTDPETQGYNTILCLGHNPEPYCTVVAGVVEVMLPKDLSEEEKDLLKHCVLTNARMSLVQLSLSTKFRKGTCEIIYIDVPRV